MSAELDGKVIIVAGGGGSRIEPGNGVGACLRECSRHYHNRGKIAQPDQTIANEIDHIAGAGCALPIVADVTSRADCERAVKETVDKFGAVHVPVNNADNRQNFIGDDRIPFWQADTDG